MSTGISKMTGKLQKRHVAAHMIAPPDHVPKRTAPCSIAPDISSSLTAAGESLEVSTRIAFSENPKFGRSSIAQQNGNMVATRPKPCEQPLQYRQLRVKECNQGRLRAKNTIFSSCARLAMSTAE
jgi:hypothetical protein